MKKPRRDQNCQKYIDSPLHIWYGGEWRYAHEIEAQRRRQRISNMSTTRADKERERWRVRQRAHRKTLEWYLYKRKKYQRQSILSWEAKLKEAMNGNP